MNSNEILISLVLPIHNEEGNIRELYDRSKKVLSDLGCYEIIFVNDGSIDSSLEMLASICEKDKNVKVIDFSRNFGHQVAITAGIKNASGQSVIVMDSDLQDPPEVIRDLFAKWREGFEVVHAKRKTRKDGLIKKITAFIFYRIMKRLASVDITEDAGDFYLMDRQAVTAMNEIGEISRFMRGLTAWIGFKRTHIFFDRMDRKSGKTAYSFKKMIKLAVDGMTSFSHLPLKLATYLGLLSVLIGFVLGVYAIYQKIYFPQTTAQGWASLILTILFLGGIQLMILGMIGEYIGRIYTETKKRPLYIVKRRINF